ncbi:MAG: polyprenyl diphosphate synthase, partial [Pseudomonadota bacterium]|nr:polyprenyl diphosphate synthase [Pseudomonadota bacterium]
ALSYGGRRDIVLASRTLAQKALDGALDPNDIDETMFDDALMTAGLPDPELLIRTSGERRISNFLLWPCAYSEFVFLDVLWPDFGPKHFRKALDEYAKRDRRFGRTRTAKT